MNSDPLYGRQTNVVRRAEAKRRTESNERHATVLTTGGVIQNVYRDGDYAFAFTAKKFIHFPGGTYLDRTQWEALTDDEMQSASLKPSKRQTRMATLQQQAKNRLDLDGQR